MPNWTVWNHSSSDISSQSLSLHPSLFILHLHVNLLWRACSIINRQSSLVSRWSSTNPLVTRGRNQANEATCSFYNYSPSRWSSLEPRQAFEPSISHDDTPNWLNTTRLISRVSYLPSAPWLKDWQTKSAPIGIFPSLYMSREHGIKSPQITSFRFRLPYLCLRQEPCWSKQLLAMIGEWGHSTPTTWYFKPQSCHFISFALQFLSVELNTLGTAVNALPANPAWPSTAADWLNMTRWPTRLACRYQPFRLMQHRMELGCLIFYALDCYAAHTSPWDCVARAWSVLAVWSKCFYPRRHRSVLGCFILLFCSMRNTWEISTAETVNLAKRKIDTSNYKTIFPITLWSLSSSEST